MTNFDENIAFLKKITKTKTIKELAEILEIPYRTFNTWQTRGEIPKGRLYEFSDKLGISIDKLTNSSINAIGDHSVAFRGDNNQINTAFKHSSKFNEFLALYEKYGNADLDALLDPIIERLKKIKEFSNPQT